MTDKYLTNLSEEVSYV